MAREMKHARQSCDPESRAARRQAKKNRKKKSKGFRTFLLIWILILAAVGAYALIYVNGMLREMQASQPAQLIADKLESLKDAQIKELFDFNTQVDEGDQAANIRAFFKDGKYSLKQVKGSDDYNIYNGNRKVLTVSLNKLKSVSKLVIFNYSVYEVKEVIPSEEKELYRCEITAPSACKVFINGKEIAPAASEQVPNFNDAANYIELPAENSYILDHLTKPADIRIVADGKEERPEMSEKIVYGGVSAHFETLKDAGCDFDLIGFAENYSRFLTDDLKGTRHGLNTIAASLIKDSDQYKKAYAWATSVDITFTSKHTLRTPPFTEQSVTNITKYSDDAISADVHLVKHMRIANATGDYDVVADDTFYLIRYNGEWKVVNIRSRVAE